MKVSEINKRAVVQLAGAGVANPRLEAELLIGHALGMDRLGVFLHEQDLDPECCRDIESSLARRISREPLAHITMEKEFWSLAFKVNADVLIPRPDTEIVIEQILRVIPNRAFDGLIVDLGTGSGIIATVLALEFPRARVTAVDISTGALAVAAENIRRHRVSDRVRLVRASWLEAFHAKPLFDLIVSNPPYVAERERDVLAPEIFFEPGSALFAGSDGMEVYRTLIPSAGKHMKNDGWLVLETGADQAEAVAEMLGAQDFQQVSISHDYAGRPRVVCCRPQRSFA